MRAVLVDTAVFAYALGGESRHPDGCRECCRRRGRGAVAQARAAGQACVLHDFDRRVLDKALQIVDSTAIRGRGAVHSATAELAGLRVIVSPDAAFDALLTPDPLDI